MHEALIPLVSVWGGAATPVLVHSVPHHLVHAGTFSDKMGHSYDCGTGVPMDDAKAVRWWRKTAKNGQLSAEFHLGEAYITGFG